MAKQKRHPAITTTRPSEQEFVANQNLAQWDTTPVRVSESLARIESLVLDSYDKKYSTEHVQSTRTPFVYNLALYGAAVVVILAVVLLFAQAPKLPTIPKQGAPSPRKTASVAPVQVRPGAASPTPNVFAAQACIERTIELYTAGLTTQRWRIQSNFNQALSIDCLAQTMSCKTTALERAVAVELWDKGKLLRAVQCAHGFAVTSEKTVLALEQNEIQLRLDVIHGTSEIRHRQGTQMLRHNEAIHLLYGGTKAQRNVEFLKARRMHQMSRSQSLPYSVVHDDFKDNKLVPANQSTPAVMPGTLRNPYVKAVMRQEVLLHPAAARMVLTPQCIDSSSWMKISVYPS